MNDISKFRIIVENSYTTPQGKILLEWPFGNKDKPSSGYERGKARRDDLINKMKDSWDEWLAMTGSEGTQRDMINFLISKVGFSKLDTMRILDIANEPIVSNNDDSEEEESSDDSSSSPEKNNPEETPKEDSENTKEKEKTEGYQKIQSSSDYEAAIDNINHGLSVQNKTSEDNDQIMNAYSFLSGNVSKMPASKLRDINDVLQDAANYFSRLNKSSQYYMSNQEIIASLSELQKRMNQVNDSVINNNKLLESMLDQKLNSKEIDSIFSDAASYAFTNNLIGNKNYARANGSNPRSDDSSSFDSERSSNKSKPAERADHMSDFASKVFSAAIRGTGGISKEDIEQLRSNSKTNWDTVRMDDKPDYAKIGWAFLRSLGR